MSDVIEAFDLSAQSYDTWYETPKGRQVLETELGAVHGLLPLLGVGVEMGAGTGIFAQRLASEARSIVCLDPSAGMLRRASSRGLPSVLASGEVPPFRDRCLDFAYLITVLEFLEEPSQTLSRMKRTLKTGSSVVILTINGESPWGKFYERLGGEGNLIFSRARLYDFDEAKSIIEGAGLKIAESFGTLTSGPEDPEAGNERVEPSPSAGVVLFRALIGG